MSERPRRELLTNPYRQIEAWYLYHIHSLEYGEQCLAALQAVYDQVEQYDALNKQRLAPTLQEWEPYDFWMEGVLRPFISPYLADLKQRVRIKRRHPETGISFEMNINSNAISSSWRGLVRRGSLSRTDYLEPSPGPPGFSAAFRKPSPARMNEKFHSYISV